MNFYTKHSGLNAASIKAQRLISNYKTNNKPMAVFKTRQQIAKEKCHDFH